MKNVLIFKILPKLLLTSQFHSFIVRNKYAVTKDEENLLFVLKEKASSSCSVVCGGC